MEEREGATTDRGERELLVLLVLRPFLPSIDPDRNKKIWTLRRNKKMWTLRRKQRRKL